MFPEGSLVLLVGAPAAGKSTLAAELVAAGVVSGEDVLNPDSYREAITGSALDTRRDRNVWSRMRRELMDRMAAGRTTVVDATNIFPARRLRHITVARNWERPIVAIRFEEPKAELLGRNQTRERMVRPGSVVSMARDMQQLATAEALRSEGIELVLEATDVRRQLKS